MKTKAIGMLVILAAAVAWAGCEKQVQKEKATAPAEVESGQKAVATVNGSPISAAELDEAAKGQVKKFLTQIYQAKRQALNGLIEEKLIEKAAKEEGVSAEAYLAEHVDAKVNPPTEEEIKAFYDGQKGRINVPFEQIKPRIAEHLKSVSLAGKRQEMIAKLKEKADVKILLEPPRAKISLDGAAYTSGDKDAPIVLVEFSDYQCPFSKRAQSTVHSILDKYKGKIRYAFFDYPLPFHKDSMKASEAARCAGEQGKYFEYNKKLFENQANLDVEALKKYAKELELDVTAFDSCLDSGKTSASVEQSVAKGAAAGVSGTPAFFINGIMISGAQPAEAFQEVIDSELSK